MGVPVRDNRVAQGRRDAGGRQSARASTGAAIAAGALALVAATLGQALALAPAARAADTRPPLEQGLEARTLEELGAYGGASDALRALRGRVAPDADLELYLALDEARSGQLDSALALLKGPILSAALLDTLPLQRRSTYAYDRENAWTNGRYEGWHWYIARARAEVAASLGRWGEALEAARLSVAARPLLGREWIILATCAAHAGHMDEASNAVWRALLLDPALPEAQHWAGLMEWRDGRRTEAQQRFKTAISLDSTYRAPALAIMRSRLPGKPTEWPNTLLNGARRCGLITSPERPKIEEHMEIDRAPFTLWQIQVALPDSLAASIPTATLTLPVLVDEVGKIVLAELPWFDPKELHVDAVGAIMGSLPGWRFQPATRNGEPVKFWTAIRLNLKPE